MPPKRFCPDDPKRVTRSRRRSAVGETRKIAAILVSDVVGYSRLAGADEDRILARLRALRSDLIDPTIAVHHGRVVKRTGDGSIVEFRSVVDAVNCAIEVQRAMVERTLGSRPTSASNFGSASISATCRGKRRRPDGRRRQYRRALGGHRHARRDLPLRASYGQVKGRLDLKVSDLGAVKLKNIAEPIRVYALDVGMPAVAKPTPAPVPEKSAPPRLSIVVLPFANIGGDPDQEYFVDGVTESLTTDLSRIRGAIVIARNTAFAYKGKPLDVKTIGREPVVHKTRGSVSTMSKCRGGFFGRRMHVDFGHVHSGEGYWTPTSVFESLGTGSRQLSRGRV